MVTSSAPYSPSRGAGSLLFVSGQIGRDADGMMADGIADQTRQTLANLRAVLHEAGAAPSDVVKCQVFLASMEDWPAMNEVYRTFFEEPYPARSAFAVGLGEGVLVEIEAVAYLADA
jgi:2-iminobutanoate/2-iminopropanoate deaminase